METFLASAADGPAGPVAVLAGEADLAAAGQPARVLATCLTRDPTRLTIDAAGLTFADSSALHELVRAARVVHGHGGEVFLLRPCRTLSRVLAITGAGKMFTVLDEEEAEACLAAPRRRLRRCLRTRPRARRGSRRRRRRSPRGCRAPGGRPCWPRARPVLVLPACKESPAATGDSG
jgi:anti-anti-sigma factor